MLRNATAAGLTLCIAALTSCSDDTTADAPIAPLEVATQRAPAALQDRAYTLDITARGGEPPYTFMLEGAPAGLAIAADSGLVSGTPTETGTFSLQVLVTDEAGTQAETTIALEVVPLDTEDVLTPFEGTCETPQVLQPTSGLATLTGRLPEATEDSVLCGGGDRATAYFRVSLGQRSDLRVGITSPERDVVIGRAFDGCPPLRIFDDFCGRVLSETLPAGDHTFRLFGPPGTEVALSLEARAVAASGAPSCDMPEPIDLGDGPVTVMGDWSDALDENSPMTCVGVPSPAVEAVYEIELTEPADLFAAPQNGNARVYFRASDCAGGREELCGQGFGPFRLINAPADTYYMFVEPLGAGLDYQVTVEATAATLPAENASCDTAEILDLSAGNAAVSGDFGNVPTAIWNTACGDDEIGLYYAFQLTAPQTVALLDLPNGLQAELLSGDCGTPVGLACIGGNDGGICSPNLPAGDYILRLSANPAVTPDFDLTLSAMSLLPEPSNISCATAEVITSTPAVVMGTTKNAPDAISLGACGTGGAGDLFYRFDLAERADISLEMLDNNRFTYAVYTGECGDLTQVECDIAFGDLTALGVPAGPVTIVVEPRATFNDPYACSDDPQQSFELRVSAAPLGNAPPNDTCASPTVVSFPRGVGSAELTAGTTRGATNNHDTVVCPFGAGTSTVSTPGPDVVYAVDVPAPARLRAQVLGADTNTRVALLGACDGTGGATLCDAFGNTFETEEAVAAGRYYVRVDHGVNSPPTDFFLLTTLLPPP